MELITIHGSAYANSYIDLEEADLIASKYPWFDKWNQYTDGEKENALILAARALNTLPWCGTQCFPASDAGYVYPDWGSYWPFADTVESISNQKGPFLPINPSSAELSTQGSMTWGKLAEDFIDVKESIRMGPPGNCDAATVFDKDGNVLVANIDSATAIDFVGKIAYVVATYNDALDLTGKTNFGSIYIDGTRLIKFPTAPSNAAQALSWPRCATCGQETTDCSYIPQIIKEAQVLIAYNYLERPDLILGTPTDPNAPPAGTFVKRNKIGSLEQEFEQFLCCAPKVACDDCNLPQLLRDFPWLESLLECWLCINKGQGRTVLRVRS